MEGACSLAMSAEIVPGEVVSGKVVSGSCGTHHLILSFTEEHFHELRIPERLIVTEITLALVI